MNNWMSADTDPLQALRRAAARSARDSMALRAFDLLLALGLLLMLAPLLALAMLLGEWRREAVHGRYGQAFVRQSLQMPAHLLGRFLAAAGASHWPLLIHIVRGEMAWVGPRLRTLAEDFPGAAAELRPGLINPWFIRRHTAVDFGSELQADLEHLAQHGLRHDLGLFLRGLVVAFLPARQGDQPARVRVADVVFDNLSMNEALSRVRDMLDGPSTQTAQQVSFVNPACVNIAAGHRGYRRTLARAALVLPDGIGIKIGSDLLGTPLKQNVNGTDLFPRLCAMLEARQSSVFLLGGQAGVAEAVAAEIGRHWPGLRVAGLRDGFFEVAEEGAVAAQVRASGAELLLVARGVPAQDLFIDRYLPLLGVKVAMGVGGLFDFASGRIARAPQWMRETGLEWVYRLMQEPGRMWRRYLVGNLTFLVRVLLQRLRLRRPAGDTGPLASSSGLPDLAAQAAAAPGLRAVIFATQRVPDDLPLPADFPTAALPLGCQTAIEHLLEQLSQAAITEIDLVVSERPELLRALVGDGERWGLRLHWHGVKDPNRPYGLLAGMASKGARRVLIGHADVCLGAREMMQLSCLDALLLQLDEQQGSHWSGWACATPIQLDGLPEDLERADLPQALRACGVAELLCAEDVMAELSSAPAVLQAQFGAGWHPTHSVPAAWLRKRWGAMSPLAQVDPGATLIGPVLIGPGCVVEAGATVGPHVVLSRDVLVSRGTRIERSLLLPQTYVGADLDLADVIANGARLRHVRLDVESTLAPQDALLLPLVGRRWPAAAWLGRALAALLLLPAAPLLAGHWLTRRLFGREPDWLPRPVVCGRDAPGLQPSLVSLRCAPAHGSAGGASIWAHLAALIDVLQGRRQWIGMRPRSRSQWYALRPEWQQILAVSPVGLLHAPAWCEQEDEHDEACAAADVLCAVLSPLQQVRLLLRGALRVAASGLGQRLKGRGQQAASAAASAAGRFSWN
ncbi:WecB/TagA/CpsF family glycosyltransferase [Paucibacter sp. AS339]|uniref:WecB/TagA/CpsF family glycosyltransferase n=1 Tax=Paucibacter hankyongi TaxID=3133434 RepID=UPI0030A0B39D